MFETPKAARIHEGPDHESGLFLLESDPATEIIILILRRAKTPPNGERTGNRMQKNNHEIERTRT